MTDKELEIVIKEHEMQTLELKESFGVECIETACAFANAHGGYIVLGVDNTGNPTKTQLRTEALRDYENRIATATEPSVAVDSEKTVFRNTQVIVLKVLENPLKPVAYKGRSFIRKGSVNHQMTPSEIAECHLKSTGASMDAVIMPGVTRDDLDMDAVRRYMKKAVKEKRRNFSNDDDPWDILKKLEWVKSETEITRAAYLLFAKEPQIKFPQAIIHAGAFKDDGCYILDSRDIDGNIQDQVDETLVFIKRNIRQSIVVSAKAEHDRFWEYPIEALRETITNAICHRDYSSNGPIQFYQYDDRIEILNHGGLYGRATIDNFPYVNDYRNLVIAEAMKVLGYVNRQSRGVFRVQEDLKENENGEPQYDFSFGTAVMVVEHKSAIPDRLIQAAIEQGLISSESDIKSSQMGENMGKNTQKPPQMGENVGKNTQKCPFPTLTVKNVFELIRQNPTIKYVQIEENLGIDDNTVQRSIAWLKDNGYINKEHSKVKGVWQLI